MLTLATTSARGSIIAAIITRKLSVRLEIDPLPSTLDNQPHGYSSGPCLPGLKSLHYLPRLITNHMAIGPCKTFKL